MVTKKICGNQRDLRVIADSVSEIRLIQIKKLNLSHPYYMAKILQSIPLTHSTVSMRDDGLAMVDVKDDVVFGANDVAEIIDALEIVTGGKKVPVLSLFKPGNTADKEARDFTASERGSQFTKADGMVIHNLPQKIIANFYLKVNKPNKPTRFVSSEEEAVTSLKTFL